MDQASDEHEYEKEILAEVVELEVEQEEDFQKRLLEYKKQLEEWKLSRRKKVYGTHPSVEEHFTSTPLSFPSIKVSSQTSDIDRCAFSRLRGQSNKRRAKRRNGRHMVTQKKKSKKTTTRMRVDRTGPETWDPRNQSPRRSRTFNP